MHVGGESIKEAHDLAAKVGRLNDANNGGVRGIFCMPPVYFAPSNLKMLGESMQEVADANPALPFWYYHFPAKTGVDLNMYEFTKHIDLNMPNFHNFMGIKFTNEILMDFNDMGHYKDMKYNNFMGRDEILTSALITGVADAAVGSTVNFMSFNPQFTALWEEDPVKNAQKINDLQMKTVTVIETWNEIAPGYNVQKALLKMTGIDFGPLRSP